MWACWVVHALVGVSGYSEEVHPACADLDHEQDIESAQADRVEVEEVDCEQSGDLGAKERSPGEVGSPWCRRQPCLGQDSANGARANSMAQSDESPWMRRCPQRGFCPASRKTSSRISSLIGVVRLAADRSTFW